MKSILLSKQPKIVANVLNGISKIIVCKKFPKDYVGWVYIYVSKNGNAIKDGLVYDDKGKGLVNKNLFPYAKGCPEHNRLLNGKVVARFWCNKVEEIKFNGLKYANQEYITESLKDNELFKKSCLNLFELHNYLNGSLSNEKCGYAINISKLEVFDRPKEIGKLKKVGFKEMIDIYSEGSLGSEETVLKVKNGYIIKKAPANYCYIESEK